MTDIHPTKPVIDIAIFTQNQIIIFWGFILFIFLTTLYFFYKKYWKKNISKISNEEIIIKEKIDYSKVALDKLNKIKKLISNKEYKIFYFEITQIIKEYIDGTYNINIKDLTTKEIINHKNISDSTKNNLQIFFTSLDLAKFADKNLNQKKAEELYTMSFKIIEKN